MRVIVVGAGVAGLTAADAARHAGADVTVIEARNRIGGRTWTAPLGGGTVDLGAAWVHGPISNPLAEALAGAGIETRNDGSFGSGMAVWADGWADAQEATSLTSALEAGWNPVDVPAEAAAGDSYVDGVEWFMADRELEGRVGELVRFALVWVAGGGFISGAPERISLRGAAAFDEGGGGNLVPVGGYRSVVERLASDLDIRLDIPANVIEHSGPGVAVRSDDDIYEADKVVVTVPLGVLQSGDLVFDPPLTDSHALAVERLAMGALEKVVFRFEEHFWPESVHWITHVADDRAFPQWVDLSRHTGSPTLAAIYNATLTPRIAEIPAEQRAGLALEVLHKMFGSAPDPDETLVTDWKTDPWSRGSYSYVPIGAGPEDMSALAEPVSERLVLAGEATAPGSYGTVHAAFGSGLRAAAHVLGERPRRISLGTVPESWLD
jgi:polyamine oxidase